MSRRLSLRLVPDRVVEERPAVPADADQLGEDLLDPPAPRAARDDDRESGAQPPALGATPAPTPSR